MPKDPSARPATGAGDGAEAPGSAARGGDGDGDDQARAHIQRTERSEAESREEERQVAEAARAFDVRRVIGGLLALYGLVLTILGLTGSPEDRTKAAGLNVNLWAGLAMLVVGLLFVAWALTRPLPVETRDPAPDDEG